MVMRVGGLASGMDIESIVNKLMTAERIPLDKMQQDKTMLEWKRDAFRDINKKLSELDNMMLDMKLSKTFNSKMVSSSNESAVTATGDPGSSNGSYNIEVTSLATNAINVSTAAVDLDPDASLIEQGLKDNERNFKFTTFDENGEAKSHEYTIKDGETLNQLFKRISDEDNNVRMFFDDQSKSVIMETTRTGKYNPNADGKEIVFYESENSFFKNTLNLHVSREEGGEDAKFKYNNTNLEFSSKTNSYELNGVTFQFKDTGSATLTVTNNVESSFESIMKFVDKYNEVVETMNESQHEEKYRDFPPLTDEQKKEMSDDEIELWEEKAKSGLLRGESAISSGLFDMRQSWYSNVETGGAFTSLTQIGIETSKDYMDGGKLVVNEADLRKALQDDPEGVQKLFTNSEDGPSRGLVNRLEDSLESTMSRIGERAGNSGSDTLENYTIGKRMKDLNERISAFEDRLVQRENRYWREFTAMESAISRMNSQSAQLLSQFGG